MILDIIKAKENRDKVTIDLPCAYLHVLNNNHIVIRLKGKLAELLVQVDPSLYRTYATANSKDEPMLYVNPFFTTGHRLSNMLAKNHKMAQ